MTDAADVRGRSLLAVFAHPDDESLACGGLLAWSAALGARVTLVCATRGEHGPGHAADHAGNVEPLRAIRTRELHAAAQALGLAEVILLEYRDGLLPWEDAAAVEADLAAIIGRVRPEVVVTFGEDGLYWHPDHIAVYERTTAAVAALGSTGPALFYATVPPGQMRAVLEAATAAAHARGVAAPRGILGISEVDAFGAHAAAPTLVVDASLYADRKLAALRCHRTQIGGDALDLLPDTEAPRLLGMEYYRRADVGSRGDAFIEQLGRPA